MKPLFVATLMIFFGLGLVKADNVGIWRGSFAITINGSTINYKDGAGSGTDFYSANLGNIDNSSTFTLSDPYLFSFKNSGCDVTGANFYYRVFKQGNTPGAYINQPFIFQCNCGAGCWRSGVSGCGTDDQEWGNSAANINLRDLAIGAGGSVGTYVLEVYWTISVSGCTPSSTQRGPISATFGVTEALPVALLRFSAQYNNQQTTLRWSTASETNNKGFEMERSSNGQQWRKIGETPTLNGNANFTQHYEFVDRNPLENTNFYRIKQIDHNGDYQYSPILSVLCRGLSGTLNVRPNPIVSDRFVVSVSPTRYDRSLHMYNAQGRLCHSWRLPAETETLELAWPGLENGWYYLQTEGAPSLRILK